MVPLSQFASVLSSTAPLAINHQGQFPSAGINFGLDHLLIPEPSISIGRQYSVASHHGFDQNWC
jgi:hypothetical protein